MHTAFVFPGQGAQFPGMARDLYDHSESVRRMVEAASDVAGRSVAALLFDSSEEELKQTDNTQIAITVANLAARTVLAESGVHSDAAAGFSLGEYAALVDAGVIEAADAFRLVLERGTIMEQVSRSLDGPAGASGMIAAVGVDIDRVREILSENGVSDAYPALYNSPLQTVVGGTAAALAAATDALKAGGVRRVIPLKTSGPFHTPLMQEARDRFQATVDAIGFSRPVKPLYSNVTGDRVSDPTEIRTLCLDQLVSTVMWTVEERALLRDGYDRLLEVGPGTVLAGLWNAIGKSDDTWPTGRVIAAGTLEEIQQLASGVAQGDA